FQGMTTGKDLDVLGLGPSAISQLDEAYAQNCKASGDWQGAVARDLATERGLRLTPDDRLRRGALQRLYGHGVSDKGQVQGVFGLVFDEYFAGEVERLAELVNQGIALNDARAVRLTAPLGRLLVRVVAAVFDAYLPARAYREGLAPEQSSRV